MEVLPGETEVRCDLELRGGQLVFTGRFLRNGMPLEGLYVVLIREDFYGWRGQESSGYTSSCPGTSTFTGG